MRIHREWIGTLIGGALVLSGGGQWWSGDGTWRPAGEVTAQWVGPPATASVTAAWSTAEDGEPVLRFRALWPVMETRGVSWWLQAGADASWPGYGLHEKAGVVASVPVAEGATVGVSYDMSRAAESSRIRALVSWRP